MVSIYWADCYLLIDDACFICENDACNRTTQKKTRKICTQCPTSYTAGLKTVGILTHMGAHVLHNPRFKDADNPCGLCLGLETTCAIFLKRTPKTGYQIDMSRSRCPNLYKISLKVAATFTENPHAPTICYAAPFAMALFQSGSTTSFPISALLTHLQIPRFIRSFTIFQTRRIF